VALARFVREARAAAAVSSRFVVAIHAVEGADEGPYLVLEYVRGISLQQRLDQEGALPVTDIVRVGLSIASGLAAAHERGILHRDIKPGNILLADDGEVKISDFGLARAAGDDGLTSLEVLAGTPAYLAPEQIAAKDVDQRADLFSLGSVLYAMCTGDAPFAGPTALAIVRQVAEATPPPIRERNSAIPDWLVCLVERLLAKDPAQRIQTAREVVQWFQQGLTADDTPGSRSRETSERRGQSRSLATSATMLAATALRRLSIKGAIGVLAGAVVLVVCVVLVATRGRDARQTLATVPSGATTATGRLADNASAGKESYVVVSPSAGRSERFSDLTDALRAATAESTLTLHGAGPFTAGPLKLGGKALTLRAAPGSTPVISLSPPDAPAQETPVSPSAPPRGLLEAEGPLTLEGLVLQPAAARAGPPDGDQTLVRYTGPELRLRHCRLRLASGGCCLRLEGVPSCEVRNCELHAGHGAAVAWQEGAAPPGPNRPCDVGLHNCICSGRTALCLDVPPSSPLSVTLEDNTWLTLEGCRLIDAGLPPQAPVGQRIRSTLHAERNLFDHQFLLVYCPAMGRRPDSGQDPFQADARRLPRLLVWSGRDNVYCTRQNAFLAIWPPRAERPIAPPDVPRTVSDWIARWNGHEDRPRMADPHYAGGVGLYKRAAQESSELTASAFRVSFADPAASSLPPPGANTEQVGPGTP
jgi:hypothetical protein